MRKIQTVKIIFTIIFTAAFFAKSIIIARYLPGNSHALRPAALTCAWDNPRTISPIIKKQSLALVLAAMLAGCVSQGPLTVDRNILGAQAQDIESVKNPDELLNTQLMTEGFIFGFEGLASSNMHDYLSSLISANLPQMRLLTINDSWKFTSKTVHSTDWTKKKLIVFSYSNSNSVFGNGGRKSLLERLEKLNISVDLLVMFDDTWGRGKMIPANVKGVINICTSSLIGGKKIEPWQLRNKDAWVINLRFPNLDHVRMPIFPSRAKTSYEAYASRLYTSIILNAVRFIDHQEIDIDLQAQPGKRENSAFMAAKAASQQAVFTAISSAA